jgi:hypothetical protein
MRGGVVIVLLGLTALISYSIGRHDAPTPGPVPQAPSTPSFTKPVALAGAPLSSSLESQLAPSPPPTPPPKAAAPQPETKRKIEVALTAAAIAAIIVKTSRDQYHAKGHPCACPDDTMRNGRACGGRSAYSRPGGAAPLCYPTDITAAMIEDYRRSVAAR